MSYNLDSASKNIQFMSFIFHFKGYNDVSWHNPDIITPHLGKLASNGMILESHYTMHVCTPAWCPNIFVLFPV